MGAQVASRTRLTVCEGEQGGQAISVSARHDSAELQLTISEAARYFKKSEKTMRKWCRDGTILADHCQRSGNP